MSLSEREPTRELLLAQALEACIRAERQTPGSSQAIVAGQPAWARADLQRLVDLAVALDGSATSAVPSPEFRAAARARLMQHIGAAQPGGIVPLPGPRLSAFPSAGGAGLRRRTRWWLRGGAGLIAAAIGVAATLTASASALPGEPLYRIKQAQEELNVRLAADDEARALALLRAADARLDETARLLEQGRTDAALQTTQQYDAAVQRATTTYLVTIDDSVATAGTRSPMESHLDHQQAQLEALLEDAPEPARADLREALVATERGRALVAEPRSGERAQGRQRGRGGPNAALAPTAVADDLPTATPTSTPRPVVIAQAPAVPTATEVPVVAEAADDHGRPLEAADSGDRREGAAVQASGRQENGNEGRDEQVNANRGTSGGPSRTDSRVTSRGGSGRQGSGRQPAQPVVSNTTGNDDGDRAGDGQRGDDVVTPGQAVEDRGGRDNGGDDREQPVIVRGAGPALVVTGSDGGGRGSDDAQNNRGTSPLTQADTRGTTGAGQADERGGHDGEVRPAPAPAPAVVAQQPDGGGGGGDGGRQSDQAQRAGGAAAPQVQGDRSGGGGRDNGDTRVNPPSAPSSARPQPTPTPTPQKRSGDGKGTDDTPKPPATPAPTPRPTSTGSGSGGGGGGGHGGD